MFDHAHFLRQCKHGKVWSQCRCAGPKPVTIVPCSDVACPGDEARKEPAMATSDVRDAFEAWAADYGLVLDRAATGYYLDYRTAVAWASCKFFHRAGKVAGMREAFDQAVSWLRSYSNESADYVERLAAKEEA